MLISWEDFNLIISRETIHEQKNFKSGAIIDNLVNKGCRVVVLRTCLIKIPIIDTNPDGPLFLCNGNRIGNPFSQRDWINETIVQQFLYFCVDSRNFLWINRSEVLSHRTSAAVGFDFMGNNMGVNTRNLFVRPSENIAKFFKKGSVKLNLFQTSIHANLNVFHLTMFD